MQGITLFALLAMLCYGISSGFNKAQVFYAAQDIRYEGTNVNKRIQLVGSGFAPGSLMMWDGNKDKGAWIVKSYPQYALATPKGDRHIWYRGTFQFELNNGNFYSG